MEKRKDCINPCIGPDCEGCRNYKPKEEVISMETRKEKIIKFKGNISQAVADDRISQRCAVEIMNDIDAIFALPIDVPSEEEIKNRYGKSPSNHIHGDRFAEEGARWAISEIIKRNQK